MQELRRTGGERHARVAYAYGNISRISCSCAQFVVGRRSANAKPCRRRRSSAGLRDRGCPRGAHVAKRHTYVVCGLNVHTGTTDGVWCEINFGKEDIAVPFIRGLENSGGGRKVW